MTDLLARIFLPFTFVLVCLYALYDVVSSPNAFNGSGFLAAAVFLEILVVILWEYKQRFFPFLIIVFMFAGMEVPLNGPATSARWIVLAAGALAGFVIYLRDRDHSFGIFHLVALFCAVSALVSAMVSTLPTMALMKALSLLLVFLYGACGARVAVNGREVKFFSGLLLGCELMVYLTAVCYFVVHRPIFGNPNSMGAVMGIFVLPILLWGLLISEGTLKRRRTIALGLCVMLLLASYARAAMVGAGATSLLLCVATRRYRLLLKGLVLAVAGAIAVATFMPVKEWHAESVISAFLYKGHEESGLMASRTTPWQKTSEIVQRHPLFGAGFGTSATTADASQVAAFSTTAASAREHGNSYLAILEWVGVLGVLPFAALILMIALNAGRVMLWLRRTGNPFSPAVPLAAVLLSGLIHATFEDWLFAVGSYMCVFFWAFAFVLADVEHSRLAQPVQSVAPYSSHPWAGSYGIATPSR